jgi:hemerythrin-like domain-containing protein
MAETGTPARVIFFDARDTLGEVDRPGHLIPYRPSTAKLLQDVSAMGVTIGVITNLPDELTDDQGKDMVVNAVLSEDPETGKPVTIGKYIEREHVITNKAAGHNKPAREIWEYAAKRLGVRLDECVFVGENMGEVTCAQLAGMQGQRKQCPPGRDFAPALVGKIGESAVDSGREFEAFFEHEHLLGERIFGIGGAISEGLRALYAGKEPPLDQKRWVSPPAIDIPDNLFRAIAYFVHLIDHFADQVHLRAEETMLEVAIACGMDPKDGQWVFDQHEQARAYWHCLDVAWRRIRSGDADDRFFAIVDFQRTVEAFVYLFKAHAVREDNQMYPEAGKHFNDTDDAMVLNLISHFGPADITPFVGMVERAEQLLGIHAG